MHASILKSSYRSEPKLNTQLSNAKSFRDYVHKYKTQHFQGSFLQLYEYPVRTRHADFGILNIEHPAPCVNESRVHVIQSLREQGPKKFILQLARLRLSREKIWSVCNR